MTRVASSLSAALLAIVGAAPAAEPKNVEIAYLPGPVIVDGERSKWSGVSPERFDVKGTAAVIRFAWNEEALLFFVEVADSTAVVTAFTDEDPHLAEKSDAVELFLDTRLERAARMDTNDYQIAVARDGRRTTFKGSAALGALADVAIPRDWGMNLPVQVSAIDGPQAGPEGKPGYRIEMAVPWAAVGIRPASGLRFGLDVGLDDLVTPPHGDIPPRGEAGTWSKDPLFGLPDHWKVAVLRPASLQVRLVRRGPQLLTIVLGLVAIALAALLAFRAKAKSAPVAVTPAGPAPMPRVDVAPGVTSEDPLEKLRVALGQRIGEDLTAEDLAEAAGVSLRTLQRLFRERHETSPVNWLIEVRLQEAAKLIRESDDPVTKIAYRVGFKDPSHFTRRFKARFGVSPAEYRRGPAGPNGPEGTAQ